MHIMKADMPHLTELQRKCLEGVIARQTAKQIARELGTGHRVAAISPDSGARYLTTALFADGGEV